MRILLVIFTCLSIPSFGQLSLGGNVNNKIYVGGGFDFQMGSHPYGGSYTYFSLSPLVGYRLTPKTSAGTSVIYNYCRFTDMQLSMHQYGISPFVRVQVTDQFFGHAELNVLSTPTYADTRRRILTRGLIGGGYSLLVGTDRGVINFMVLYDVLYKKTEGAFASPWVFRIFFTW